MILNPVGATGREVEDAPAYLPGLRASLRSAWPKVWPLLAVGLAIRVLFLLVGAKIYYLGRQSDIYTNGDSYSYLLSFHNLLEYGRYTFDLTEPEAAVGRMPGYPLFYGLHYLIFGSGALQAVAVTQLVLDTLGIWLLYTITARLAPPNSWAPALAALLLAFYPFSILWITVLGTESLGLLLVLLWWATMLLANPRRRNWALLGALLAVIVFVREFLGVCMAITLLYLAVYAMKGRFRSTARRPLVFALAGFLLLYTWWPVRNYMVLGRFIPLKPAAAGYANLREDVQSALSWMLTWTNDVTTGMDELMFAAKPSFPDEVIHTLAEKQLLDSLIVLSRSCASSFHVRMQLQRPDPRAGQASLQGLDQYRKAQFANTLRHHNCNAQVSAGYDRLRESYLQRHPWKGRIAVPLQNLQKVLFKNQLKPGPDGQVSMAQRLSGVLFIWRSVLLAFGLLGAWRYRKVAGLWPGLAFSAIIFVYMAIIFRSMEMRYLLQADVVMLVPAALIIASWLPRRLQKSIRTTVAA
ncbi:hypothetical protein E5K00_10695 [Hymenobacter aquaticus]|uniref:Glycosyltransferase RgtA/B/C/D-like domain-containing protein n=1 Tax=Hymenobacter aquaticus TaxID=1867101 RepID=A0A4Z0Q6B2_9BACT|nr:glycosyltransferase family 39 protein [Hymenobacter aquaticus]TGE25630.1 hypothetical protein E5K00_10695 [Hymenobacter aquaticus]